MAENNIPVHIAFHLSDFVDYTTSEFYDQIPNPKQFYVPKSFFKPLNNRIDSFKRLLEYLVKNGFTFRMLKDYAEFVRGENDTSV